MNEYLHIVSLIAPSPPDFGGVFDLYYKIPALAGTGKKIILHYFDYKKGRDVKDLEAYCEEINAYERGAFIKSLLTLKPYIVASRIEPELIHRLNRDDYPVLLEGIHCTGIIPHLNPNKKVMIRVHNNEAEYYQGLYDTESNFLKKLYFLYESTLLTKYQKQLPSSSIYAFVSTADQEVFKNLYKHPHQVFIPCFLPWQTVQSKTGMGSYCLYHANLSVPENYEAALWLTEQIFSKIDLPLIIAGRNADHLRELLQERKNIQLISDPSDEELRQLIQDAHVNVLPSLNATGVKLKLLHSLFEGRFCISNYNGVNGSGVEQYVTQADSVEDWVNTIQQKMSTVFTVELIEERNKICSIYNNTASAQKLSELL